MLKDTALVSANHLTQGPSPSTANTCHDKFLSITGVFYFSKITCTRGLRNSHRATQQGKQKEGTEKRSSGRRQLGQFPLGNHRSENISTAEPLLVNKPSERWLTWADTDQSRDSWRASCRRRSDWGAIVELSPLRVYVLNKLIRKPGQSDN